MSSDLNSAKRRFADLIGDIGDAWGLPRAACRVHALLYLNASKTSITDLISLLDLTNDEAVTALSFLRNYELAWTEDDISYRAHLDPWDAMLKGLDQRRGRDLPSMKSSLIHLHKAMSVQGAAEVKQVEKMIDLVNDLSAIHTQAFRMSPRFLRGMIGLSGRAARIFGGND